MLDTTDQRNANPCFSLSRCLLAGILVLCFILRFICLLQIKHSPFFGFFVPDACHYDQFALKLLQGDLLFKGSIFVFPLYPIFLSGIYDVFGHKIMVVGMIQILTDTLSCGVLYLISVKLFDKKSIGLIASFIYACYGLLVFYPSFLLGTTLSVFFNVLLFYVLLSVIDQEGVKQWFFSGAVAGLTLLITANTALFLVFFIVWSFYCIKGPLARTAFKTGWLIIGISLVLVPFSLRNYMIDKKLSPFPRHGGLSFYRGNNPGADGTYVPIKGVSDLPMGSIDDSIAIAEHDSGRKLDSAQASDFWFSKAMDFIKTSPAAFGKLIFRKFVLFWNDIELAPDINYYFCKQFIPVLRWPLLSFGFIAPLAVIGIWGVFTEKSKTAYLIVAMVFAYMFSLVLFFVTDRYRLPAVPFIIILSAYAIDHLSVLLSKRQLIKTGVSLVLMGMLFVMCNCNFYHFHVRNRFSTSHFNLGQFYYDRGRLDEAIAEYQKALSTKPDFAEALDGLKIAQQARLKVSGREQYFK